VANPVSNIRLKQLSISVIKEESEPSSISVSKEENKQSCSESEEEVVVEEQE